MQFGGLGASLRGIFRPERRKLIIKVFTKSRNSRGSAARGFNFAAFGRGPPGDFCPRSGQKWARQDSNLQPNRYERSALTIELQAHQHPDSAETP